MIDVTLWRSLTDAHGTYERTTWPDLLARLRTPAAKPADPEKPNLGGWSAATFKDDRRAKVGVRDVTALVLDIDAGDVPFEKVELAFFGLRAIVHSTRRYTPGAPRWRVVVAVSRPMTAQEYGFVWTHERDRLATLGITLDEQAKDASRFWFLPCEPAAGAYICEALVGSPLDVDALLPMGEAEVAHAVQHEKAVSQLVAPKPAPTEPPELARISMATRRKRAAAYLVQAEPSVSGEHGHNVAMRVVGAVVRGFALGSTTDACMVLEAWNARCEPPWSPRELGHKVDEAMRVGAVPWGKMLLEPAKEKPAPEPKRTELSHWNLLGTRDLAAPLPPIPWLCEAIRLAPGAVTLVAGYGYSRKTMALQSLALSVAAHRPLWGLYSVRQGRVVHLDYEQGARLTKERYQRLARGMGVDLTELDDAVLQVACMPRIYLETQDAIDSLLPVVEGAALVIVDSLRAAFPHADENASEVRSYLDALNHLSERTGATVMVIHHARKPNVQNGGTATHAIRGSSALFDACQSVFVFEGEKDSPTTVHHQKDRVMGSTVPEFGLTSEDTPGPTGLRHGLVVRHLEAEQIAQDAERKNDGRIDAAVERTAERIVMFLAAREDFAGPRSEIKAVTRGKTATFDEAWRRLLDAGVVVNAGSSRNPIWRAQSS